MITKKSFNWNIFFILLAAAAFGIVAILPYTLALQADTLATQNLPLPLEILIPIQVLQNIMMFGIAILIGLFLANRTGLGLPILEAKLAGKSIKELVKPILLPSILLGVLASVAIVALDTFIFQPALVAELGKAGEALNLQTTQPAAWKGLLASFYGGINEEILLRLFLFTLLAWLGKFISHTNEGRPTISVFWTANIIAAILFGLGHLPATALLIPLTPLVIVRAILLNGLAGIAFGYLYWTRGLEAAMLSHFSADIILHVLLAL
jgi:membrane protease YdiL (CAAX protease family)